MLIFGILLAGCVGDVEEKLNVDGGGTAATTDMTSNCPATPTYHFNADIQPDLDAKTCTSSACHGSTAWIFHLIPNAMGADLNTNYAAVKMRANMGAQSPLLINATGGAAHPGMTVFMMSDTIYTKWLTWINECAPQ